MCPLVRLIAGALALCYAAMWTIQTARQSCAGRSFFCGAILDKGVLAMVSRKASLTHSHDTSPADTSLPSATQTTSMSDAESARALIAELRDAASEQARERLTGGAAPIRIMAAMVAQLEARARELELPREIVSVELVNRTIGDVDVRRITARDDGPEFVSLADDMGLALPGEE